MSATEPAVRAGPLSARAKLSVVIITRNEEANIARTLENVRWADEVIVVDAESTDRTQEIAREHGAKVFVRAWKGFADQRNWALTQASGDWILPLDADEVLTPELEQEVRKVLAGGPKVNGYWINRRNHFLGRWMKHGGYYPDPKLRLFRRGSGSFEQKLVHEPLQVTGPTASLKNDLLHYAYPTLSGYIEHMNHYSSLGAEMAGEKGYRGVFWFDIAVRPSATFVYNYVFRLGFLDGREGLLQHLYHAVYVSWKYAKVWESARAR